MLRGIVVLLCATQVLQIANGAPTLGDDLVGNFQKNMDTVHGNLMAGLTNVIKPLADLVDKVPEALLGVDYGKGGIIGRGKDEIEDIILGTAGAFNSGVKLGSTLLAAPFKLAGDGMMAMENMVVGKSLDLSESAPEHKITKRDIENNEIQFNDLIDSGFRALERVMAEKANPGMLRNQKALRTAKMLNTLMTVLKQIDADLADGMKKGSKIVDFLEQMAKEL